MNALKFITENFKIKLSLVPPDTHNLNIKVLGSCIVYNIVEPMYSK